MLATLPTILLHGKKFPCEVGATVADLIKITHPDAYVVEMHLDACVVEMDGSEEIVLHDPSFLLREGFTYEARVRRKEVELTPKLAVPPIVSIAKDKKKKTGVMVKSCSGTCSKVKKKINKRRTSNVSRKKKMNKKGQLDTTGYNVGDLCSRLEKCMAEEKLEENSTAVGEELCSQMKMMSVKEANVPLPPIQI